MIVRAAGDHFILIHQHDHALLAGKMAENWGGGSIPGIRLLAKSLVTAIQMHDIGWVELDAHPVWNESADSPYTFLNEPLERRLPAYWSGINEVSHLDPYAGLLCSMHYESFFTAGLIQELGPQAGDFVRGEKARQSALSDLLVKNRRSDDLSRAQFDLDLLKLLDNMSLYVCLNEPGAPKASEHAWYRDGFKPTRVNPMLYNQPQPAIHFNAHWLDSEKIALEPFPFDSALACRLPIRRVGLDDINKYGYAQSAKKAGVEALEFHWGPA